MGSSGYTWTPLSSMTAAKYQRYGYVHMRPFLPGEKRRSRREMEKYMKGYKEVRDDLDKLRKTMEEQEKARNGLEKKVQTSYYKSPVGTRYLFFCL